MKKSLCLVVMICFSLLGAKAQLANTQWKGTVKLQQQDGSLVPADITWEFKKDSVWVYFKKGKSEIMTFADEKNVLIVTKILGPSPCEIGAVGKYAYAIKDDKLTLTTISDQCEARSKAPDQSFTRIMKAEQ